MDHQWHRRNVGFGAVLSVQGVGSWGSYCNLSFWHWAPEEGGTDVVYEFRAFRDEEEMPAWITYYGTAVDEDRIAWHLVSQQVMADV